MDDGVEQPLAATLGRLAVARILFDVGNQASIEDAFTPTATLECMAKICPCKMAVLQGPVISVMSVGSAHNSLCYRVCSYRCRCRVILSDTGFHAAEGDPTNLKLCQRGEWQDRMLVETVLSMLTLVCHWTQVMHRGWVYVQARLAFTMAAFNVLVQWHGLRPYASGFVPLSIADFSL